MIAAAKSAGVEIALDFAIQCSPDHPWLVEHPEWFERRPDGTLKYAENPPKRYQDIYNVDWDTSDREGALGGAARDRPRVVSTRCPLLPGRQPTHEADPVLGVVDRRSPRGVSGRDLPRGGVHAPGTDDDTREGRLQSVVHVLHLEEHEGGNRRVHRSGALVVCVLPAQHVAEHARHPSRVPPGRRSGGVRGPPRARRDALPELRDLLGIRGLRERSAPTRKRGVSGLGEVRGEDANPRRPVAAVADDV